MASYGSGLFAVHTSFRIALVGLALALPVGGGAADPPAAVAAAANAPQEILLETSDGVPIAAWYYPLPKDAASIATVILVHDLDGSHRTVEPLAKALQAAGCAVVAPDLRGHGKSVMKSALAGAAGEGQSKALRKGDFEAMAASVGGRVRDQADMRGDLECVFEWIRQQAAKNDLQMEPLVVVGSGVGGTLAARWAAADAAWPPLPTRPQGRQVDGVVLVSPAFTSKGFTIQPALSPDLIGRAPPVLLLAGEDDRDSAKIFDQIKKNRPRGAFDGRKAAPAGADGNDSPTLFLLQLPVKRSGDALASYRSADPRQGDTATMITGFLTKVVKASP